MQSKTYSAGLLVIILLFLFDQTGYCQPGKAEAGIKKIMEEAPVTGLSVAVVKNNTLIYTQAFGVKERETNTPLTPDCLFRIASISKSFSATSILQLVEKKKISLDTDVSDLMGFTVRNPKYPETIITLRLLLSHLSSINDSQGYFTLDAINPAKNSDWAKCYNDYQPGKGYQYCNLNFNMAGTIIEKYSGERFDQYVKHHILDPLGLYGGYCVDSLDKSRFASIYEYNGDSARFFLSPGAYNPRSAEIAAYTMGYSTPVFSPTGGMKISAPDLAGYMMMHMNLGKTKGKRILSKKSARAMQTPYSEKEGYGFALLQTDKLIPGKIMTGHTGSAYGLHSAMFFNVKDKFGIVVISNGCDLKYSEGFNTVIRKVVNVLYENLIGND
ncbi:MAG: beta-lactamase family protein [Chitinophagales bacterium]|nr:beta-lactamase family protein [Chitinophagales bacterium]